MLVVLLLMFLPFFCNNGLDSSPNNVPLFFFLIYLRLSCWFGLFLPLQFRASFYLCKYLCVYKYELVKLQLFIQLYDGFFFFRSSSITFNSSLETELQAEQEMVCLELVCILERGYSETRKAVYNSF